MPMVLFINKKYIPVDNITNCQTTRYLIKGRAKDVPNHIRVVQMNKNLSQGMVLVLVAYDG